MARMSTRILAASGKLRELNVIMGEWVRQRNANRGLQGCKLYE